MTAKLGKLSTIFCVLALFTLGAAVAQEFGGTLRVTLTAPTTGGPVSEYVLYVNGVEGAQLQLGMNELDALITAPGTYTFEAEARNASGATRSDPVIRTFEGLAAPGKPIIEIQFVCDGPCVITP